MRLTLILAAIMASGCAARQPMVIQNAVHTLPPASFWICPSANICRASNDPADIPVGYTCISQANKVTVCSPGGTVSAPAAPKKAPKGVTFLEHFGLGAASYGGTAALAGPGHRVQVGIPATTGIALAKELTDIHDHTDTKGEGIRHILMILVGAGAVATFYH